MVRTKNVLGFVLFGLGIGMILSVLLQTGICAVMMGIGFLLGGALLLWGNGA